MEIKVNLNTIYKPSDDVVAREVQGEFVIIPITSGIGAHEDEIFSLNETGKAVWKKLDGKKSLNLIIATLSKEFKTKPPEIKKDVLGLVGELLKKKMLVKV